MGDFTDSVTVLCQLSLRFDFVLYGSATGNAGPFLCAVDIAMPIVILAWFGLSFLGMSAV